MVTNSIDRILNNYKPNRKLPVTAFVVIILAYMLPIVKELLFYYWIEWLWLLYIIPPVVLAYYKGLKGAIINILVSASLITATEVYLYLKFGRNEVLDLIQSIYLGTLLAMSLTSFIVAFLATKLQVIRNSSTIILENVNSAIIIVDNQEKLVYANELMAQLSGYPVVKLVGQYWADFKSFSQTGEIIRETLKTGQNLSNLEINILLGQEEKKLIFDSFTLRNDQGDIIGVLVSLRDITEKKLLETKAQQSEKFNALGEIAAGLAHEIRNPLTSITGYLQLLEKRSKAHNQEHSKIMLEELNKIKRLLTEFLVLAKPAPTKKESCFIENLLEDVINFVNCQAILYDIEIRKQINSSVFKVKIDKEHMKQVLINIMQNSIDAMPTGGILSITCSLTFSACNRGEITIKIKDTGTGIEKNELSNIYNPFFTTKQEGTGLGLAVSYKIIEDHDGSLSIDSIKNQGTTATINLPIVRE